MSDERNSNARRRQFADVEPDFARVSKGVAQGVLEAFEVRAVGLRDEAPTACWCVRVDAEDGEPVARWRVEEDDAAVRTWSEPWTDDLRQRTYAEMVAADGKVVLVWPGGPSRFLFRRAPPSAEEAHRWLVGGLVSTLVPHVPEFRTGPMPMDARGILRLRGRIDGQLTMEASIQSGHTWQERSWDEVLDLVGLRALWREIDIEGTWW